MVNYFLINQSDVIVTNGKGVFSASLGEFALAVILYFAKDLPRMRRNQAAQQWAPLNRNDRGPIVGYCRLWRYRTCCRRTLRWIGNAPIFATKRHLPQNQDLLVERFYPIDELHDMLALCDYLVIAAPLTSETRHLIGEAAFPVMKSNAVLINIGRGPVVEERSLLSALVNGRIRGAGLDVFDQEPLAEGHPFYEMENVLLSPHCADHIAGWRDDSMRCFLAEYRRFVNNEPY